MEISAKIFRKETPVSAYETIQTIIAFGMFTIALIGLIVKLLKKDEKK